MIDDATIRRAQKLIAAGYNNAQVASRLGICRTSVSNIRNGKRRAGQRSRHKREPSNVARADKGLARCLICGAECYGQCQVCEARKSEEPSICLEDDDSDLSLKLEGEALVTYRKMRAKREQRRATKHDASHDLPSKRPAYHIHVAEPRHHGYLGASDSD